MASPEEDPAAPCVRQVLLLEGERVQQRFDTRFGLMETLPATGPLLVLTTHRLMTFGQGRELGRGLAIGLDDLHAASVDIRARRWLQLLRGVALVLLGLPVYLFVGLFVVATGPVLVPALIGGAVSVAGALLVARYLLWEREGTINFSAAHGAPWQISFEYHGDRAFEDAGRLVAHFFRLKQERQGRWWRVVEDDWPYTPWG